MPKLLSLWLIRHFIQTFRVCCETSTSRHEYFTTDRDRKSMVFCICAFNAVVRSTVRTCLSTRRPDFPRFPVGQFTWSSSRSSIWMSCTCSGADCPFPWSGASTSCPLSARCSSSQQLDSSEVELWDASSSDSKDEDEYDLTMIVIVVCGRVVLGDLRVAWTSRACSVQEAHKYLNKYAWLNTNNSHLEFCLSSTEDKDRLLKDLWRLLWRWMRVVN